MVVERYSARGLALIDAIDEKILAELQRDAKMSNVELAQRVHLSPSPCLARVRAMEKAGILKKYVALLDPHSVGLGLSVFIQIRLEKQVDTPLLQMLAPKHVLRVVVADVDALQEFIVNGLTKIPGLANIRSSFALKQVKFETALPLGSEAARSGEPARTRGPTPKAARVPRRRARRDG